MTDISAVLGMKQLARINQFNRRRTDLALRYRERLSEVDEILSLSDPHYAMKHAWHLFVVRLDFDNAGLDRANFIRELKRRNVGTGPLLGCAPSEVLHGIKGHKAWHVA